MNLFTAPGANVGSAIIQNKFSSGTLTGRFRSGNGGEIDE